MTYMQSRAEQMVTASLQRSLSCVGMTVSLEFTEEKVEPQLCVTFTTSPSQPDTERPAGRSNGWSSPRRMWRNLDLIIGHFCGVIVSVVTGRPRVCYRAWLHPALNPVIIQQMWRPQNSHYLTIWSNIHKQGWSLKRYCIRRGIPCGCTRKCSRDDADKF